MFVESVLVVNSEEQKMTTTKWYKVEFEIGVSEDIPTNKAADLIIDLVHTSFMSIIRPRNFLGPNEGRIRVSTDNYIVNSYWDKTVVDNSSNIKETIKAALGQGIPKHSFGGDRRTIDDDDREEMGIITDDKTCPVCRRIHGAHGEISE